MVDAAGDGRLQPVDAIWGYRQACTRPIDGDQSFFSHRLDGSEDAACRNIGKFIDDNLRAARAILNPVFVGIAHAIEDINFQVLYFHWLSSLFYWLIHQI